VVGIGLCHVDSMTTLPRVIQGSFFKTCLAFCTVLSLLWDYFRIQRELRIKIHQGKKKKKDSICFVIQYILTVLLFSALELQ